MFQKTMTMLFVAGIVYAGIAWGCGGGVTPYIPTQSGSSNASKEFFIIEKGVADNLFDVKKLQPLFRNVILTGNSRKETPYMKKMAGEKNTQVAQGNDSLQTTTDTIHNMHVQTGKNAILNIHRIH